MYGFLRFSFLPGLIFWALFALNGCTNCFPPAWSYSYAHSLSPETSFRGLHAVSRNVCWVTGSKGHVFQILNGGKKWEQIAAPGMDSLDFRDVYAIDRKRAWVMSSGDGPASRIYHTADAGDHWFEQFRMQEPKGFLDAISFWDEKNGIAVGDPIDGKLYILLTNDYGENWNRIDPGKLPVMLEGEYAFAASGTCLAVKEGGWAWIGTGGSAARIFRTSDFGQSWSVYETPIDAGDQATGIFSVCFRDSKNGMIVGGNYSKPDSLLSNTAYTVDGGETWIAGASLPYRSCVTDTYWDWITAGGHVIQGMDGGQATNHWDDLPDNYNSIDFPGRGKKAGFLVGNKGMVICVRPLRYR